MTPSARAAGLVVLLAGGCAAWLIHEHRQLSASAPAVASLPTTALAVAPTPIAVQAASVTPAPLEPAVSAQAGTAFKCRHAGRTLYTDDASVCDDARRAGSISTRPAIEGVTPVRLPSPGDDWPAEAARPVAQARPVARDDTQERCAALAARIAYLDGLARQPLMPSQADWVRSERRLANDQRFSLRC